MPTYYVWSGNLRGVAADAEFPEDAVVAAVRENVPCVLGPLVRATKSPAGEKLPGDVFWVAPYEESFPELFDGSLEVQVIYGETT